MRFLTIDELRDQAKAEGDDDAILTTYGEAAETVCERLANRRFFADAAERDAAAASVSAQITAAYAKFDTDEATAFASDDDRVKAMLLANAQATLNTSLSEIDAVVHGMIITRDVIEGMLMLAGHFYRSRESVVTGQGAAAVELPLSTQHIINNCRYNGPL